MALTPISLTIRMAFERSCLYKGPLKHFGKIYYEMKKPQEPAFLLFTLSIMSCVNQSTFLSHTFFLSS